MCDCRCPDRSEKVVENSTCLEGQYCCKLKEIEQKCYLDFPDRPNFNEFPRFCPSHGNKSKPTINEEETCLSKCLQKCKSDSSQPFENGLPIPLDSIGECMKLFQTTGSSYPSFPKGNAGSTTDPIHKRLEAMSLESFIKRPKSPVVTETHSFRAQKAEEFIQPKPKKLIVGSHAYRYCRDLGLVDEIARLFESEIRHLTPEGYVQRPSWRNVSLTFLPNSIQYLHLREFPGGKFFVCGIRYDAFSNDPDLHFGDQILEIVPLGAQSQADDRQNISYVINNGYFTLRVIPTPFYRKITFRTCDNILKEIDAFGKRGTRKPEISRSWIDLGFIQHQRRIINVRKTSPAKLAGLKVNDVIIEVNKESVLEYSDSYIIRMIRNAIHESENRSVELGVVPAKIYDALMNVKNGKVYKIDQKAEMDVNAWSDNKIFGVKPA
nr:pdz domain containing protein [Hymenolepis microstoma]